MKTQDIKNMGLAYFQVLEAMKKNKMEAMHKPKDKMDPVDADELKGSHADRDDKDIDNDGDADKSDEYLHNRRKAVKAAITKEEVKVVEASPMSISAKKIKHALASAKAQAKPKDQVSLKKAPFDIPKESVNWSVYNRILENRAAHYKGATKPEMQDDLLKGGGAKKMKADIEAGAQVNNDDIKGATVDVNKAANAGPAAKARPGDNKAGDKTMGKPVDVTQRGMKG